MFLPPPCGIATLFGGDLGKGARWRALGSGPVNRLATTLPACFTLRN